MALTREQLKAKARGTQRREAVAKLPSGDEVRLRSLTRSEQRQWRKSWRKKNGEVDMQRLDYSDDVLLAMCIVDAAGEPVFTATEAMNGCFDNWDIGDTSALIREISILNNFTATDDTPDDAVKNSDETPGNGTSGVSAEGTE